MDPVDTFHFPDGTRFAVPADLDVYRARLREEFPAEAGTLARMTVRQALDHWFTEPKLKLLLIPVIVSAQDVARRVISSR